MDANRDSCPRPVAIRRQRRSPATITTVQASDLVVDSLDLIQRAGRDGPVLDLACGDGRNGIYLVRQGLAVTFADRDSTRLAAIAGELQDDALATFWTVDLEAPGSHPLVGRTFAAILVFRYLHRPLMGSIKAAVQPGGLVVYETFTVDQPRFGRPTNPDFLLRPGELEATFADWDICHHFEGVTRSESSGQEQAIAQLVARKPVG